MALERHQGRDRHPGGREPRRAAKLRQVHHKSGGDDFERVGCSADEFHHDVDGWLTRGDGVFNQWLVRPCACNALSSSPRRGRRR